MDRIFEDRSSGYRHESKYFISQSEAAKLRLRLDGVMKRDPHSDENRRYVISSVYFDDAEDHSLAASDAGLPYRKKYRIRAYNYDDSFISLEKKEKRLDLSRKTQLRISKEDYREIMLGRPETLKKYPGALAKEFYYDVKFAGYRSKTIVEYKREVYTYPISDVRITLDTDIRGAVCGCDMFERPALAPVYPAFAMLLEVKYNHILPEFIASLLPRDVMSRTANCKYVLGRTYV